MTDKKTIITFIFVAALLLVPSYVIAEDTVDDTERKGRIEERVEKLREKMESIKLNEGDGKNTLNDRKGILEKIKETVINKGARIANGTVTAVNGATFTVETDEETFTVTTDDKTRCQRHFWGKCTLSEIAVNNKVNVWGRFTNDTKTTMKAHLIRNLSIMKRHGTFLGDVISKDGNTIVIKSKEREEQTVTVISTTKYVMRNMKPSTLADIQVGHRVRVKGVWDKTNNTITEVTSIKNYSLPLKTNISTTPNPTTTTSPTSSPTLTPTVTSTTTPTVTPTGVPVE